MARYLGLVSDKFGNSAFNESDNNIPGIKEVENVLKAKKNQEIKIWKSESKNRVKYKAEKRPRARSGILGVGRYSQIKVGKEYIYWRALWTDVNGNIRSRTFSVTSYGERKAKFLACKTREDGVKEAGRLRRKK